MRCWTSWTRRRRRATNQEATTFRIVGFSMALLTIAKAFSTLHHDSNNQTFSKLGGLLRLQQTHIRHTFMSKHHNSYISNSRVRINHHKAHQCSTSKSHHKAQPNRGRRLALLNHNVVNSKVTLCKCRHHQYSRHSSTHHNHQPHNNLLNFTTSSLLPHSSHSSSTSFHSNATILSTATSAGICPSTTNTTTIQPGEGGTRYTITGFKNVETVFYF